MEPSITAQRERQGGQVRLRRLVGEHHPVLVELGAVARAHHACRGHRAVGEVAALVGADGGARVQASLVAPDQHAVEHVGAEHGVEAGRRERARLCQQLAGRAHDAPRGAGAGVRATGPGLHCICTRVESAASTCARGSAGSGPAACRAGLTRRATGSGRILGLGGAGLWGDQQHHERFATLQLAGHRSRSRGRRAFGEPSRERRSGQRQCLEPRNDQVAQRPQERALDQLSARRALRDEVGRRRIVARRLAPHPEIRATERPRKSSGRLRSDCKKGSEYSVYSNEMSGTP